MKLMGWETYGAIRFRPTISELRFSVWASGWSVGLLIRAWVMALAAGADRITVGSVMVDED